jgi:Mn-containing catalase
MLKLSSQSFYLGPALTNSAGVPWSAAYIDTTSEPTADLRSNIAAEARAKIVYERPSMSQMTPASRKRSASS